MTPVPQTILGTSGLIPGNCLQAAVASVLDLPIGAVPHFGLFRDWRMALMLWWQPFPAWIVEYDRPWRSHPSMLPLPDHVVAVGSSPRGTRHAAVIDVTGSVVWDPHPSRAGLAHIDDVIILSTTPPPPEDPDDRT